MKETSSFLYLITTVSNLAKRSYNGDDLVCQEDMSATGKIQLTRKIIFNGLPLDTAGMLHWPIIPESCQHNAHMYYILLNSLAIRSHVIQELKAVGINAVFHYVPLHLSPAGKRLARVHGDLPHTEHLAERLLRLPLWLGLDKNLNQIVKALTGAISHPEI